MRNASIKDRFLDAADDLTEYGRLELDALKLRTVGSLATLSGGAVAMLLTVVAALVALHFLGITLVLLLARWTGSLLCATAIMTGFFILLALILFLLRKKLFVNGMVRKFAKMFFKSGEERR